MELIVEVAFFLIAGVFSVLWWLLRQKDAAQAEQIKLLFLKHDEDAEKLAALSLKIAEMYYVKPELDVKFVHLENSIREGMRELGGKFDRLTETLIVMKERTNGHNISNQ